MKSALLIVLLLGDGSMVVEAAYPMTGIVECESIASHHAVAESYPDRLLICWENDTKKSDDTGNIAPDPSEAKQKR